MSDQINYLKKRIEQRVKDVIDQYRSMILDPVEQELGESPNWKFLRSRLLKAMGDRGLAGRIFEILDNEFSSSKASSNFGGNNENRY